MAEGASGRKVFSLWGSLGITGVQAVRKKLADVEKTMKITERQVAALGKKIESTGKAFVKWTAPLAAVGIAAIKFGADFDKAMSSSLAIMGDLSDVMRKDLSDAAREVAKTTRFSAAEAAEAYYFLASAGYDAQQSIAALSKVAAFAQAGNFSLALATDLLTDAQSALGLASKDAAENELNLVRVSDVLVKANTLANASVQQFSESLTNKAGAALRLLNKSVEEGVAVLAVFADQGVKGAGAGEMLNIVMRDLQRSSIDNRDEFLKAGVAVYDAAGNMRNMADIVGELEKHLHGMSDEQRRVALTTLGFQDKSVSAMMALLGTSDAIRKYQTELKTAGGITDEVARKQIQNFWDQLGLVKDRLIDVALTIWEALGPPMMGVVIPMMDALAKALGAVADWFQTLPGWIKDFVVGFAAALVVVGPLLVLFGKFIVIAKPMIAAFIMLTKGQLALNAAMAMNPIGLLIVAIGALVAISVVLYKNWDAVSKFFVTSWQAIQYAFQQGISYAISLTLQWVKSQVEGFGLIAKHIPGLNKAYQAMSDGLAGLIEREKALIEGRKIAREEAKLLANEENKVAETVAEAKKVTTEYNMDLLKNADAKKTVADATKDLAEEEKKAAEDLARRRAEHEAQWSAKHLQEGLTRTGQLEYEYSEAMRIARELGADTADVEQYYSLQRRKIAADEAKEKIDLDKRRHEEALARQREETQMTIDSVHAGFGVFSQFNGNRIESINQRAEREKQVIADSLMSEEEKALAIEEIDKGAAEKKRKIARQQAILDKAQALFSIGINTAVAIVKALPNVFLSAAIGVLGGLQAIAVAARPLPMRKGGLVRGGRGGVVAEVGEADQDELVLPMRSGVSELVNQMFAKMSELSTLPLGPSPAAAMAGASGFTPPAPRPVENHWHIGMLVADDRGIKELERRQRKFRVEESQRRGEL